MKKVIVTISVFAWFTANLISAATIPAGTPLVARTLEGIWSQDMSGTQFAAQLENNVAVNGKVVLHAGTKLSGKIVTSRRSYTSTQKLTVDITAAQVGGRSVPINTTGAVWLEATGVKTRHNVSVSRAAYQVAVGRRMEFRLAQPIQL